MSIIPTVLAFVAILLLMEVLLIAPIMFIFCRRTTVGLIFKILPAAFFIFFTSSMVYGTISSPPYHLPVLIVGQSIAAFLAFLACQCLPFDPQYDWWIRVRSALLATAAYVSIKLTLWAMKEPSILNW